MVKLSGSAAIKNPVGVTNTIGNWRQFYSAFRAAVRNRNKPSLKELMSNKFNSAAGISYSEADGRDAVLRDLSWETLDTLIRRGVGPVRMENKSIVRQSPGLSNTGMVAVFELERDGVWRWTDYFYNH
jgi:hypothetical protein